MALGRNRQRINVKAKEYAIKIRQLTSGGAETTMLDIGLLTSIKFSQVPNMVDSKDAGGDLVHSQEGSRMVLLEGVMKQTTKEEIEAVKDTSGKFYHAYMIARLDNGTVYYQEFYIPLCIIEPAIVLDYVSDTERTIAFKAKALMPKAAVTVTPAGFNVAAETYYTMTETATTALGQVTTAAGTIYTAAV